MKKILLYFTNKYFGDWEKIYLALNEKEIVPKKYYENTQLISNYISIIDNNYPDELKTIYKPPFSLFWYGKLDLLNSKMIGIYGTTKNKNILNNIINLKNAIYVVDYNNVEIIKLLVKNNINFIAISNTGINKRIQKTKHYLNIIENNNLVITEIPSNNYKVQLNDQIHDRLIFGISKNMIFLDKVDQYNFESVIQLCKLESVKCYSFDDLNNDYLINIKDINKIYFNSFLS